MKKISKVRLFICCSIMLPTTTMAGNPSGVGDIVGRDLNVPVLGWYLGHIGMWNGEKVIETLRETPVIQQNSLADFKAASTDLKYKYWGARYGKGSNFYTMVSNGWDQRNYNPIYTLTRDWIEGKREYKCVKYRSDGSCIQYGYIVTRGQFRCDTFVNYMYLKGTGSYLVARTATTPIPRGLYNAMPKVR